MVSEFNELTKRKLKERLDEYLKGITPRELNNRSFFYECKNEYITTTGDITLDSKATPENLYTSWQISALKEWFKKHRTKIKGNKWWWRIRDALNITASSRAKCLTVNGNFDIEKENRERIMKDVSFVLVCEKGLISKLVFEVLLFEEYKLNVISSVGFTTNDTKDAVVEIAYELASLQEDNFYILFLHDYDLAGIQILADLKKLHNNIIDVGINEDLLDYLEANVSNYDRTNLEEGVLIKKDMREVKQYMIASSDYTLTDYDFLQGTASKFHAKDKNGNLRYRKKDKTPIYYWIGKRIELDAINGLYGIKPMVEYIAQTIENKCKHWDLSRIGVKEFKLTEPHNEIQNALFEKEWEVKQEYNEIKEKLLEPKNEIIELLEDRLNIGTKFNDLVTDHWLYYNTFSDYRLKNANDLREKYKDDIELKFVQDYDDDLEKINDQIECYNGDVRKAEDNLREKVKEIQEKVNNDTLDLPEWDNFQIDLDVIETGEDELEYIDMNNKENMLTQAIEILTEELKSIKDETEDIDEDDDYV